MLRSKRSVKMMVGTDQNWNSFSDRTSDFYRYRGNSCDIFKTLENQGSRQPLIFGRYWLVCHKKLFKSSQHTYSTTSRMGFPKSHRMQKLQVLKTLATDFDKFDLQQNKVCLTPWMLRPDGTELSRDTIWTELRFAGAGTPTNTSIPIDLVETLATRRNSLSCCRR